MTRSPNPQKVGLRAPAGLVLAPVAWFIHQQAGSNWNYGDCRSGDGLATGLIGVGALLVVAAGAALSYAAWRAAGADATAKQEPAGRFVAALSLMFSALLGLTIVVQILAGTIVPACAR